MKKTLSTIAAALFAASIGTAQPGCTAGTPRTTTVVSPATDEQIAQVIESREQNVRQALDEIARSVYCVRTKTSYRRDDGAGPNKNRSGHGTAFAYERRDGYTYLVTNHHVITDPEHMTMPEISHSPGAPGMLPSLTIKMVPYTREGDSRSWLVENGDDANPLDDIAVEVVDSDEDLDIAVVRTRQELPVSDAFIRDESFSPETGDEVYIVGYPQAWQRTVTRGIVSNPYHVRDGEELDILDITGTFGNSGSPYFIRRGDRLHWAGTMGQGRMYRGSSVTLFILGTPLGAFYQMLEDRPAMDTHYRAGSLLRTRIRIFDRGYDGGLRDSGMGDGGMGDSGMGDSGMGDSGMGDSGMGDSGTGDRGPGAGTPGAEE